MAPVMQQPTVASPSNMMGTSFKNLMNKVNVDSLGFGGGVSKQLSTLFTAGVKALLPVNKELYVTRIVDALMELKNDVGVENYLYSTIFINLIDKIFRSKGTKEDAPRCSTKEKYSVQRSYSVCNWRRKLC